MSLDLFMNINPCPHCYRGDDRMEFNYTYNVSSMWYAVYPEDDGMVFIEGMTGEKALPKLQHAYHELVNRREEMRKLNPSNGWGDYDGFLKFLCKLIEACKEHPTGIWGAWR